MPNSVELRSAAQELIDVMGLVPNPKRPKELFDLTLMDDEMITQLVKNAIPKIEPGDVFTPETQLVIAEFQVGKAERQPKKVEVVASVDDLIIDVEAAGKLADLKEIAVTEDVFKPLRDKLTSYKAVEDLRSIMLDMLSNIGAEKVSGKQTKEKRILTKVLAKPEPVNLHKKKEFAEAHKHAVAGFTRVDAICETLKAKKAETFDDWAKQSDEMYTSRGGRSSVRESSVVCRYIANALSHFDIETPRNVKSTD